MRCFTVAGLTLCALVVSSPASAQQRRDPKEPLPAELEATLTRARAAYDALDYERVMPLTDRIITETPESSPERCAAYSLKGSALAGMGNAPDAETVFASLVLECPQFELPEGTSPRIQQPFLKARAQRRPAIALVGTHPTTAIAGEAITFDYELRDPAQGVQGVGVRYRPHGAKDFAELGLLRIEPARWGAAIPGEWTASHAGAKIEFYVATVDRTGSPLFTVGTPTEPMVAVIEPRAVPIYRETWFWVAAAGVLAVGVTSALLITRANDLPPSDLGQVEFP